MTLREEILRSGLDYKGHTFWEDKALQELSKSFIKDYEVFGEDTAELYTDLFGEETKELFEAFSENRELLTEIVWAPASLKGMGETALKGGGPMAAYAQSKSFQALKTSGVFQTSILGKLGALLSTGFGWVKKLFTQGLAWITSSPIARIAAPVIALAGSAALAIKLVNKIRGKKKMKPLTASEQAALQRIAEKDKDKIEEYKKAMKK